MDDLDFSTPSPASSASTPDGPSLEQLDAIFQARAAANVMMTSQGDALARVQRVHVARQTTNAFVASGSRGARKSRTRGSATAATSRRRPAPTRRRTDDETEPDDGGDGDMGDAEFDEAAMAPVPDAFEYVQCEEQALLDADWRRRMRLAFGDENYNMYTHTCQMCEYAPGHTDPADVATAVDHRIMLVENIYRHNISNRDRLFVYRKMAAVWNREIVRRCESWPTLDGVTLGPRAITDVEIEWHYRKHNRDPLIDLDDMIIQIRRQRELLSSHRLYAVEKATGRPILDMNSSKEVRELVRTERELIKQRSEMALVLEQAEARRRGAGSGLTGGSIVERVGTVPVASLIFSPNYYDFT